MKRTKSPFYARRTFILTLLSFVAVAALVSFGVSARRASREAALRATNNAASTELANLSRPAAVAHKAQDKNPNVPNASSITATLTDNLALPTTKVAPGGTINYTAVITNNAAAAPGGVNDALNLAYNGNLDTNTTFVPNSKNVSPLAFDDDYTAIGNTLLEVGNATAQTGPQKSLTGKVTDNDVEFLGDTFTISTFDGTGTAGGTVTMVTTGPDAGSFTYVSAANFSGDDTFTYTLRDDGIDGTPGNADDLTGVGKVTITVSNQVWYVDNSAAAGGTGTSTSPFDALADVSGATGPDTTGDIIFLRTGNSPGSPYLLGITLLAGQTLWGENETLIVDGFTLLGANPTDPTITNTNLAGDGVTLATSGNNTLKGFTVGNTSGYDISNTSTSPAGTVTIFNVNLNGTGGLFRVDSGGALTVTFDTASTTSATGNGIQLSGATGSVTVNGSGPISGVAGTDVLVSGGTVSMTCSSNITQANNAPMVSIGGGHTTGTITFTGTLNATNGTGLQFDNADSTTSYNFNGTTTLGGGDAGIDITNGSAGTFNFGGTTITNPSGVAFNVDGSSVAVTGGISISGAISKNTAGRLIDFNNYDTGTAAFSGSLSCTSLCDGIEVTNDGASSGTVNFSNGTKTLNTSADTAVNLDNNDGGNVNFTGGGLDIDTTTGGGFNAINGGTVTVTGSGNTIDTGSGRALNVSSTDVGGTPLTFQRISSNGANGGILLSNTGSNPALTVTSSGSGTCTAANTSGCSGGVIQNSTGGDDSSTTPVGTGIVLNNTISVSLTRMHIHDHSNYGIRGTTVNGFTLANSVINATGAGKNGTNASGPFNDSSVYFHNAAGVGLQGTVSVTNSHISGGFHSEFWISNTSGILNATFTSDEFGSSAKPNQGDGIQVEGLSAATVNLTVQSSTFTATAGDHIQWIGSGTGGGNLDILNNVITNNHPAIATGGGAITLSGGGGGGNITMDIQNNTIRDGLTNAFTILKTGNGAGTMHINFNLNQIGVAAVANSGSLEGSGLSVEHQGGGTMNVAITNNQIRQYNNFGINVAGGAGIVSSGNINTTITGNTLSNPGTNGAIPNIFQGIHLNNGVTGTPGTGDNYQTCWHVKSNSANGSGRNGGNDLRARSRMAGNIRVPGYGGGATDTAAVSTYIANQNDANPNSAGAEAPVPSSSALADSTFSGGAACTTPTLALRYVPGDDQLASAKTPAQREAATGHSLTPELPVQSAPVLARASAVAAVRPAAVLNETPRRSHHAQFNRSRSMKTSMPDQKPLAPDSGDPAVGPITIGTLPGAKSVTIVYAATVDNPPAVRQVSHQGTVTFTNPNGTVMTDDTNPLLLGAADPTVTLIDTTVTWDGSTSSDWNVATNWTPEFVPNTASDVIIPNGAVGNEPTLTPASVTVFSLDLQGDRTLTINSGSVLNVSTGLTTLAGALAGGPYTLNCAALTINRAGGITMNGDASVSGVLTLTSGNVTMGLLNTITVGSAGSIVRPAGSPGYIIGALKKTVVNTGFIFTVGTANGYTPVDITTASGGGDLTVETIDAPQPTLETNNPGRSLTEYWKLTEGNPLTASMVFHYLQSDVPSIPDEVNYRIIRVTGVSTSAFPLNCPSTSCVDPALDTFTISGVSSFSDWTIGAVLSPTAADGTVTGRIVDGNGAPVEGAVVMLTGDQNRKFITNANGVYRFDKVETNGFYNVTPSRVNYNFSPAVISFSQLGETTEASFGATATGGDINPLDTPEYFVRQNYLDFLSREPDEAGFNFWSDQILSCGGDTDCVDRKRTHVSAAYFFSIEFQATGGLVDRLYRASYGVRPTFAEFRPDAAAVAPGLVVGNAGWEAALATGKTAFIEAFVQRAAFRTAFDGTSNETYIDALIANTGVSFTAAERSALVSDLGNGVTRAGVLRAIVENPNVVAAKRNEAFVMMEYFGYLRREPDAGGYLFWLTKLNNFNGNFEQAEMVRSFIISGEYRDRFPR